MNTVRSDAKRPRGDTLVGDRKSGPEKGVITKRVFSLEEALECLKSLHSVEPLENDRIVLYFPKSGGSLESLNSLESL